MSGLCVVKFRQPKECLPVVSVEVVCGVDSDDTIKAQRLMANDKGELALIEIAASNMETMDTVTVNLTPGVVKEFATALLKLAEEVRNG